MRERWKERGEEERRQKKSMRFTGIGFALWVGVEFRVDAVWEHVGAKERGRSKRS